MGVNEWARGKAVCVQASGRASKWTRDEAAGKRASRVGKQACRCAGVQVNR